MIPISPSLTSNERIGAVLFYGVVALLLYLVFRVVEPFLGPLAWAGIVVVLFYRWHNRLARRWGKTWAATASTVGVAIILVVPVLLVATAFVHQSVEMATGLQKQLATGQLDWANHAWTAVQQRFSAEGLGDLNSLLRSYAEKLAAFLASEFGVIARNVAGFVFDLAVMLLATFYLFLDGPEVMARLRRVLPFEAEHRDRMLADAQELIFASVTSSLAVAAVHGAVGGIVFASVGISAPLFWGVMMAFFSLVPLVGSSIIWVPAAIWLIAEGHPTRGIILIIVCTGVVTVVENILRPWLITGRAQLGGLVVFISVLGGISVFGPLGVVLGPIVVATAASLLDIYTHPEPSEHAPANPMRR